MKGWRKGLLIALGIVVVIGAGVFATATKGLGEAVAAEVGAVDLGAVEDGAYTGRYDFGRWRTAVEVEVRDHRIADIRILEDVRAAQITNCAGEMARRVIAAQDTRVDAVSGATATSKAYLKAIEDALTQ